MKVLLRNPRRELEIDGPTTVASLLHRLDLNPESVLVIVVAGLVIGAAIVWLSRKTWRVQRELQR